jgi:hypothetical protein
MQKTSMFAISKYGSSNNLKILVKCRRETCLQAPVVSISMFAIGKYGIALRAKKNTGKIQILCSSVIRL